MALVKVKTKRQITVISDWDGVGESTRVVIPYLEKAWKTLEDTQFHIHVIRANRLCEIMKILPLIETSEFLVFTSFSPLTMETIKFLRSQLYLNTPAYFHLHGNLCKGATLGEEHQWIRTSDLFLVTSECDRRVLRLLFKNARIQISPLPLTLDNATYPRNRKANSVFPIVFAGRITEQKNLHNMLFALWIIKQINPGLQIDAKIYGWADRSGDLQMGAFLKNYENYLRWLVERLDLGAEIHWNGFVPHQLLWNKLAKFRHLYVSPSLQLGENFGVAPYLSLSLRNPAVLSSWGGHRELKRRFEEQVSLIPVYQSKAGPFISPVQLATKILGVLSSTNCENDIKTYSSKFLPDFTPFIKGSTRPLKCTKYYSMLSNLMNDGMNSSKSKSRVFSGYDDKAASPIFKAHGMSSSYSRKISVGEILFVPPWVRFFSENKATVRDPHKGKFIFEVPMRRSNIRCRRGDEEFYISREMGQKLVRNGYAFIAPRKPV